MIIWRRVAIAVLTLAAFSLLDGCDLLVAPTPFGAPTESVADEDDSSPSTPTEPTEPSEPSDPADPTDPSTDGQVSEEPGVTITPTTVGATEGGAAGSYEVVLTTQPTAEVTVSTAVTNGEANVLPTSLTFTTANWDTPQTVTVTAVDDEIAEGAHSDTMTHSVTSGDTDYEGITPEDVTVSVVDNDSAGVSIMPLSIAATEGGADESYQVVLTTEPTADVTVTTAVTNGEVTVSVPSFTFNAATWDTPQTVTVTAVDDEIAEGAHSDIITHSVSGTDTGYAGLSIDDVTVSVTDNDTAGVSLSSTSVSATEGGTNGGYTVVLTTQPTADVTVTPSIAGSEVSVSPPSLTFTSTNWDTAQMVTVTAVDDAIADGSTSDTITHSVSSTDTGYAGLSIDDVTVSVTDNDIAGVSLSSTSVSATEGGADGSYTVVLTTEPTADVTVSPSVAGSEVSVSPASLTFTSTNWDTAQTVTVTALDDALADGSTSATITHSVTSGDLDYDGIGISNVTASVTDNEATIIYNANSANYGTAPTDPNVYNVGDTVATANNPGGLVQNGAVFAGWNTEPDGSGDSYAAGGSLTITGDTTLYAEWDTSNAGFAGGDGSTGTPYQIQTHEHLNNVRTNLGANYVLISDVDLNVPPWNAAPGWVPIGDPTTPFTGNFNGNTFAIQNLFRDEAGRFGLFDVVQDANIGNLGLENVSIQGGNGAGALVSLVEGTSIIRRIYVTGALQTFANGGGLVARLNGGTIEESITDVDISITGNFGGGGIASFVGSTGRIRNSYTMGFVDFDFGGVGGFVGRNEGVIETSFSIGAIPNVGNGFLGVELATTNSNFYDQTTSGKNDTTGATPQTTLQMQTLNTFSAAGWDISTGTGTVWGIDDGSSYPYLNWQPAGTGTRP